MSAGSFVTRNAKAVVSTLHGVIAAAIATVALLEVAPPSLRRIAAVVAVLLIALELLRTFNVWLVQNNPAAVAEPVAEPIAETGGRRRADRLVEPALDARPVVREVGRHTVPKASPPELRQARRVVRGEISS